MIAYLRYSVLVIAALVLSGVAIFRYNTKPHADNVAQDTYPPTKVVSTEALTPLSSTHPPRTEKTPTQASVEDRKEELTQEEQLDRMETEVRARINFYFEAFSQDEQDQLNQIKSAYGYFNDADGQALLTHQAYLAYDDATLKSLSQHDDLMAIQILGDRASDKNDYSTAMRYYLKAASLGSLQDIENIKSLHHVLLINALSEKDHQKVQDLKLKIYAWLDIYRKRGGWEADKKIADFKANPMFDASVTQEEQVAIEKYSEYFYKTLEDKRKEKDLPPFDNRTPDLLKEYYELMSSPLP